MIVTHHVIDDGAVRAHLFIFTDRACNVFHIDLAIELCTVRSLVTKFYRRCRRCITRCVIIVPEHKRIDGAEFQGLAANHTLFNNINPELFRIHAKSVENHVLHIFRIRTIALVTHLTTRRCTFLGIRFATFRRAARFVIYHIVKKPRIQGTQQKVIAKNANIQIPMDSIVIRQAANENIIFRYFQIFGIEPTKLNKAYRIFPFSISIYRNIDVKFTRLVSKVRFEFTIEPGFQILSQRSL